MLPSDVLSQTPPPRGRRLLSRPLLAGAVVWAVLVALAAVLLAAAQSDSRRGIQERYFQRAQLAAGFVDTYVAGIFEQEREHAARHFTRADVSPTEFSSVAADAGFSAGILLDGRRVAATHPPRPALFGRDLTPRYAHLRSAAAGRVTVSNVIDSASARKPVVAFAFPFRTPYGTRVYSGAQGIGETTAGDYLRNALALPGARLYMIDARGAVIAKSGTEVRTVQHLADLEPQLAAAIDDRPAGSLGSGAEEQTYTSAPVDETPWRVVVVAPSAALYRSVSGPARTLPWLVLAGFVLMSFVALLLMARVLEARRRLDLAARVDALTGVANRRALDERLCEAVSASRRSRRPVSVLLLDVDHFKRLNDQHGHQAGDLALTELAALLRDVVRSEDVVGRWGGEEFLVIAPDTDAPAALALAERIRASVAGHAFTGPSLTVSVGVSTAEDVTTGEALVGAADAALYAAKARGRDAVAVAPPADGRPAYA